MGMHNEQLHGLHFSKTIMRVIRNLRERDHLEDLDVEGRITLKWVIKKQEGEMDWIRLAQDLDKWWALVNTVINL
jgi:hypothetical protein